VKRIFENENAPHYFQNTEIVELATKYIE